MPSTGIIIAIIDIALIVHAAKTGRFSPWGFIILFLPGIGALAYVVVELLPAWFGSQKVQRARAQFAGAMDPTRRYRQLRDDLELVDTIANRAALAEECLALGKYDEALGHYDRVLAQPLGEEPAFMLGKARAEFNLGAVDVAIATLEELKRRWPDLSIGGRPSAVRDRARESRARRRGPRQLRGRRSPLSRLRAAGPASAIAPAARPPGRSPIHRRGRRPLARPRARACPAQAGAMARRGPADRRASDGQSPVLLNGPNHAGSARQRRLCNNCAARRCPKLWARAELSQRREDRWAFW